MPSKRVRTAHVRAISRVRKLATPTGKRGRKPKANTGGLRTAPGPLTPTGQVGGNGRHEAQMTLSIEARREKVLELYTVQQLTMEQVAKHLGVSNWTVCNDLHKTHAEMRERRLQMAEDHVEGALRRLARNDRALLPYLYGQIPGENPKAPMTPFRKALLAEKAHKRLVESERLRAQLQGTLAPQKVAFTDPTGTQRYHELPTEQLERMLRERELQLGMSDVVEAETVPDGEGE
jgi:hypothetical protein